MKVFSFTVLALAFFAANAAPRDGKDVAADVIEVINEILDKIPEPVVDYHDKQYVLDLVIEKLELLLDNIVLKGIKALDIKQMDYDESTGRLDYDLTFGDVEADVDFEVNLSGLVNIKHHPTVLVDLKDLKLAGYTVVDTKVTPNQLTDFKLLVTLGGAKVELTNILNDNELTEALSKVLNENLPNMVDNIAAALEPVISPIIQSAINIILRHTE